MATPAMQAGQTGVLGSTSIDARHVDIFAEGYDPANLQGASYDLRVATTKMILPDGTRVHEGVDYQRLFLIQPGEVAMVSTRERIRLVSDLSGLVSVKFTYASKGILALSGMIVDPGYGLDVSDGRRLHFIIANVGQDVIPIVPGVDRVASLQLLPVHHSVSSTSIPTHEPSKSPSLIENLFADSHLPLGLSFFQSQSNLRNELDEMRNRVDEHVRGLSQIVLFGHFLFGTAIIGAIFTTFLAWAGSDTFTSRVEKLVTLLPENGWQTLCFFVLLFISFGVVPYGLIKLGERLSIGARWCSGILSKWKK